MLFLIAAAVSIFVCAGRLEIQLFSDDNANNYAPDNSIVEVSAAPDNPAHMIITATGGTGKAFITEQVSGDVCRSAHYVEVLPGGIIYNISNGDFSGYHSIAILLQAYILTLTILLITSFLLRCRHELYSYTTLYYGSIAMFFLLFTADLFLSYRPLFHYNDFHMIYVYDMLKSAGNTIVLLSAPLMILIIFTFSISNFCLLKLEGKKFSNLLGLLLSLLILCGYAGFFLIVLVVVPQSGSEWEMRIGFTVTCVYAACFAYFEVMLLSVILCGIVAAKRRPAFDKTHVIILGCAIARDGMPLPLLRGRIDRAIAFAKAQKAETGRDVKFVPSGGKGSDEVISEAESMRNYLLSQGIPAENILLENKSVNTRENMCFSLEQIEADCEQPQIAFSTSSYHVLRSGIISRNAGLSAEGMGSRTKWYFWPNAFVREFIGLIVSKWKQHVFWFLFFTALFLVVNLTIPM